MFDCLHDMGDPVGAARHVRESLAADGTWMIVEPAAGDRVEDNLNPVGRAYYGFSTLLCTPSSLSQDVGLALGAQAGEARIRDVVTSAGFSRFRRVERDAVQHRVRGSAVTTAARSDAASDRRQLHAEKGAILLAVRVAGLSGTVSPPTEQHESAPADRDGYVERTG